MAVSVHFFYVGKVRVPVAMNFRPETLSTANVLVVDAQATPRFAPAWGGLVAAVGRPAARRARPFGIRSPGPQGLLEL